mgnify:CR=1 FL=1
MGFLFIGLAGFGATNLSGTVRTVGEVGDTPIEVDDYARALTEEIRAIEAAEGRAVPFTEIRADGVDQQVLASLIATAALDNEAARLGLSVGDDTVAQQILGIQAFQGPDGSFDREAYRFALDNAGLTEAGFEADLRDETTRTILNAAVLAANPMAPAYADSLLTYLAEGRAITWATLTTDDLATPVPPRSDAEIEAFYDENIARFTRPEARQITYAWVRPLMVLDEVEIDEELLRATYEERSAIFNQPERRLVERLAFADEAAAEEARRAIGAVTPYGGTRLRAIGAGDTSFEDLVADRGLDLADIDLGDVSAADLGAAADGVFAATSGDIVGPLPSDLGPALYRVNGVLAAQSTPFEEARPLLREELAADRARRLIESRLEAIDDLLAAGATLEELAQETALELGQIDWYAGLDSGIAAYPAFREAAAAVTPDDFPELIELNDGGVFALRLDGTIPAQPIPLSDIRDEVARAAQDAAEIAALTEQAETAAAALREGRTFAAEGLLARRDEGLIRGDVVAGAPAALPDRAFALEPGAVDVIPGDGLVALLRVDAVVEPDTSDPQTAAIGQAAAQQASTALSQDLFQIYLRGLQTQAGIQIDQQALNAVHANFQ